MKRSVLFTGVLFSLVMAGCGGGGNQSTPPPVTPTAATPAFSPAAGTFSSAQSIALSDSTPGASIYYTTNGTTPTASSSLYGSPLSVSATTTIEAIAIATGYNNSAVASGTFTINLPAAATPTFSPAPGSYVAAQSVTLTDSTTGATIYYTTDGSTPTTSSTQYSAAINVAATVTLKAIAIAPGYTESAVASGTYTITGPPGPTVSVVLSTADRTNPMAPQPSVTFFAGQASASDNIVVVDENQQYQSVEGFGAAFTDSAAYLLKEVAPSDQSTAIMNDLFTRNGAGIGLSFMRIPMGASDIARSVYSFDDLPSGQTDPTLAKFSIAHDQADVLPIVQQAKTLNPQLKIMANPWSPPGWMKDSDNMIGGSLLHSMYAPFADYFVKYIQAYQAAGVPIDYISLQNEPLYVPPAYPGMSMDANTQLTVLRDHVLPALTANSLTTQVLVYDHNWDTASYPETVLGDPTIAASAQVAGTAWHGYGGTPGAQQTLQNLYPAKGNWETEHSGGTWVTDQYSSDMVEITHVLRNSGKAYVKWSLALDENLGPNLTTNAGLGGCATCTPIVTVNSKTGAVTKDIEYYTLGHYSKFVLSGAVRIYSSNANGIDDVAFQNPDGSKALIAFNNSGSSRAFKVQWGTQLFSYTLPSMAAATFTWSGTQSGESITPAGSQIQASSYSSESGLASETTSDSTGGYDLGYVNNGATAVYKNVNFGSSVTTVQLRGASPTGGATATFYLDSPTGTPIATLTIPNTGGWQTWQTVSAPVTSATGMHNLYVTFTSGANVNWYQFQ